MTAISVSFNPKVATDWDPQKPITTTKMNQLYDNTTHLREWIGADYYSGAVKNHKHNGLDSSSIEVGPNMLRNGSFESGSDGWTLTAYTGGTAAVGSTGAMHGNNCLALTSTVLGNGGGYGGSDEYLPVAPGMTYFASQLVKASAANVSSKIEIIWYDSAKSQISTSIWSTTNTPTTATSVGVTDVAPSGAAYARVRITGGVPSSGSATGTIYIDGVVLNAFSVNMPAIMAGANHLFVIPSAQPGAYSSASTTNTSATELFNARIMQDGIYRISFAHANASHNTYTRIYKNGAAFGTLRIDVAGGYATYAEDLAFAAGDTIQVFNYQDGGGTSEVKDVLIMALTEMCIPPSTLLLGER